MQTPKKEVHFLFFSVCCIVFNCSWQLIMLDEKQKSCVKCIHLATDDGLYDWKTFYSVKIVFCSSFTEKCFAIFDQSNHMIYLMWYWLLPFFRKFSSIIPFTVWLQDSSQIKRRGTFLCLGSCVNVRQQYFFFNWKLNITSFIFMIWTEQFWIWFSWKLITNFEISIVF